MELVQGIVPQGDEPHRKNTRATVPKQQGSKTVPSEGFKQYTAALYKNPGNIY